MELDKRIINGKRPLTCFDIEEANKYIGKLCYMCDEYNLFYQLNLIEPAILMGVEDCEIPFHNGQDKQAEFCLPCDWVTKEKKYRPYTLQEFFKKFPIGKPIIFRQKGATKYERHLIINGYSCDDWSGLPTSYICIGTIMYSLDALFIDYEYKDDYTEEFKPFGVEVEE